jgi:hypothetical protein
MTGGKGGRPHGEGPGEQEKILLRKKVIIQLSAIGPQARLRKIFLPNFSETQLYTVYYRSAETYTRHL